MAVCPTQGISWGVSNTISAGGHGATKDQRPNDCHSFCLPIEIYNATPRTQTHVVSEQDTTKTLPLLFFLHSMFFVIHLSDWTFNFDNYMHPVPHTVHQLSISTRLLYWCQKIKDTVCMMSDLWSLVIFCFLFWLHATYMYIQVQCQMSNKCQRQMSDRNVKDKFQSQI